MDIKHSAVATLKGACSIFLQDIEALPEEAFTRSFGPATRTVADMVYEVNLVNDHVGMVIRGEEPFEWPEEAWIKAPVSFKDKDQIVQAFKASSEKIIATAEGFTAEELEGTVQTEQGETTRYGRCKFMALHLWYHSGQINFIQTMLGDADWHWK